MKKSSIIITIISAVMVALGAVLLLFAPNMLGELNYTGAADMGGVIGVITNGLMPHLKALVNPQYYVSATLYVLPALAAVLLICILIHLIALIVKKRPGALVIGIIDLVFGFVGFLLINMFVSTGWWFGEALKNVPGYVKEVSDSTEGGIDLLKTILIFLPYILGALGFALAIAALIISIVDVNKYPGKGKRRRDGGTLVEPLYDASDAQSDADAREEIKKELREEPLAPTPIATINETPTVVNKDGYSGGGAPTIVQYIYNNGSNPAPAGERPLSKDDIRSIVAEEIGKKDAPTATTSTETIDENDLMTTDDLRSIIREEVGKAKVTAPAGKEEAPVEPIEEEPVNDDVLTSDDLRSIIREEIANSKADDVPVEVVHDEEEDDSSDALTSDDLRKIIAEEIAKANGTYVPEEPVEEDTSSDTLTSDDLRRIIAEEIEKANKKEEKPVEEKPVEEKPAEEKPAEKETLPEEETEILTSDDLRSIIREEIISILGDDEKKDEAPAAEKAEEAKEEAPVEEPVAKEEAKDEPAEEDEGSEIATTEDLRAIIAEEMKKVMDPQTKEIEKEESEIATTDDLRSIIRDELSNQTATEAPVVEEEKEEETPLTANDLRTLIQEALDEHDNPERRELTEDEARSIIVEQIRSYYATKKEGEKEDKKALKEKEAAEAKAKDEEARRVALEKKLEDEIAAREKERAEREADRKERLEAEKNREAVSLEDIRDLIRTELTSYKPTVVTEKTETVDEKGIKEIIRSELSSFREEQAKANEEAAQEAMDAHLIAQARADAEAEEAKAQSEEIKNLKANAVTSDDVRTIIAEELDKRLAALLKAQEENKKVVVVEPVKEEPKKEETSKPLEEKKETIVIEVKAPEEKKEEVKETPKEEPVVEEEAKDDDDAADDKEKAKIVRVPFNERMLTADKETINNYNELKAECLSYGLKSRLSNSGDTFRLHTKTYVKIVVAGKGLKLYLALDPKDYADNPIPLHNAGHKNIYKDIPGVFKVKSALSLRRAKQLIADACEKDGLEQGKIVPHNYAKELKDYVPQLGKKDDDDED